MTDMINVINLVSGIVFAIIYILICQAKKWYKKALKAGYEPDDEDRSHLIDVFGDKYTSYAP